MTGVVSAVVIGGSLITAVAALAIAIWYAFTSK